MKKKVLTMMLSALMLAGMTITASAWEKNGDYVVIEEVDPDYYVAFGDSYPASQDWEWPACTSGELLKGTIIAGCDKNGNHRWKNTPNGNASAAFDGDTATKFDAFQPGEASWAGMILDEPYELTEVRIMPEGNRPPNYYLDRMNGCAIQGSNDGVNWINIIYFGQNGDAEDYHIFTPTTEQKYIDAGSTDYSTYWVGHGSYTMYRFINLNGQHCQALEIEFYGNPAPATTVTPELIAATTYSNVNFYNGVIDNTGITSTSSDGSITGTIIGAGGSWKNANPYQNAWDGNKGTIYDPAKQSIYCWTGIQTETPVTVTEIKVMPRVDYPSRLVGGTVQGSNDGKMWTTLAEYTTNDAIASQAWVTKTALVEKAFTMFRYVNNGANHGDVAEIALFADDAQAPETAAPETAAPETAAPETAAPETAAPETAAPETAAPETAAPETAAPETAAPETAAPETAAPETDVSAEKAPQTFDAGIIAAAVAVVSAAGYMIARKRK